MSPWNRQDTTFPTTLPEEYEGWIVSRISQEHGVLGWMGKWEGSDVIVANESKEDALSDGSKEGMKIGDKIRIWPNHACIAGVGFDWYLIIDSTKVGREDEIIDVWQRWRGW